jgi:short-subunit dehydrogenase
MGGRACSCYTQEVNVNTGSSRDLLVIGGTSSLGAAIIAQAKQNDLTYLATGRNFDEKLQEFQHFLDLDLSDISSIDDFLETISGIKFEKIIYCIGAASRIKYDELNLGEMQEYITDHVSNAIYLIVKLSERLDDNMVSTLAAISSRAAIYPSFDFCYAASKGALASFVRSLSRQLPTNKKTIVLLR